MIQINITWTHASAWLSSFRPLINSGRSVEYFGSTATRMIGVAIALISVKGGQNKVVDKVALFKIYCSKLPAPWKKKFKKSNKLRYKSN